MSVRRAKGALQHGLGAVAALVVLVVLSALAAAILRLGTAQQQGQAMGLAATRASLAARAGVEWGLYQAFKGSWTACAGASQTLDLTAEHGVRVTVSCSSSIYNDGQTEAGAPRTVRAYTLDAVACNSATACPDAAAATRAGYVERRRQVLATD